MEDVSGALAAWNNPSSVLGQVLIKGLFSGNSDVSGAASRSGALLDTSGQVVGDGVAVGGTLSNAAIPGAWPWYVWAAGALVGMAIIKKKVG